MQHSTTRSPVLKGPLPLVVLLASGLLANCGGSNNNMTGMNGTSSSSSSSMSMSMSMSSSSSSSSSAPTTAQQQNMGMWIANGANVVEFAPSQFAAGLSDPTPQVMINSGNFGAPQGVTFDAAGDLWVLDPNANVNPTATTATTTPALLEFTAAQLKALTPTANTPTANAIITVAATATTPGLAFPQQAVFDGKGNFWVTDHDSNALMVFSSAQLAALKTGTSNVNALTPAVIFTVTPVAPATTPAFNGPLGIAFDAKGDLFVANNGGVPASNPMSPAGTQIFEFFAATLAAKLPNGVPTTAATATTALTPDVILNDTGGVTIQAPWALAFDHHGNLFSSNANPPSTVVAFAPSSLTMTGMPTPMLTIEPTTISDNATLSAPNGICFDAAFDLAAVSSAAPFGLVVYDAPRIISGLLSDPSTFIAPGVTTDSAGNVTSNGSTLNAPAGCVFGPLIM